MKKSILSCSVFILLVTLSKAQTTYDVFTYTEPAGYTKTEGKDYINYTKSDEAKGTYCILSLYAADKSSNTVMNAFNKEWKDLVAVPLSVKNKPATEAATDVNGWKTMTGSATFDFNSGKSAAMLFCFTKNGMAANLLAVTNGTEYETDLTNLLESIKLASVKPVQKTTTSATTTKPTQNTNSKFGSGISGVWVSYTLDLSNTSMTWKERVFYDNGTFLDNVPHNGLIDVKEDEFRTFGTYSVNGNSGTMNKKDWIAPSKITLVKPTELKIDNITYYKSENVNGKTFTGSYTSYAKAFFADLTASPVGDRPLIHFNSNGTFTDEGYFKHFAKSYDGSDDSPGKGTYTITDYTMILKYTDGTIKKQTIITPFGSKLGNGLIRFGNATLNKYK